MEDVKDLERLRCRIVDYNVLAIADHRPEPNGQLGKVCAPVSAQRGFRQECACVLDGALHSVCDLATIARNVGQIDRRSPLALAVSR
jgi:hypothetical protein